MDGIALSWILRIQELQLVLANTQRELQAQRTRQHEAQALLGQTLQDQDKVQQAALEVQLQKAKLHFAIFKLETKGSNKPTDHTLSSNSIACEQSKLDQETASAMFGPKSEWLMLTYLFKVLCGTDAQLDRQCSCTKASARLRLAAYVCHVVCCASSTHSEDLAGQLGLVISKAKLPQSTSSWTPFGWELNKKFDSKYITVGEHTVHYLTAGQGKTVILMIASQVVLARSYRSTVNAMSREHTVVCLELPGCGRSDSVKQPLTHQQYADWIVQFLHYMDITKAVVIGHSCSTAPAIALAESHSSLVSHLILVSAIGGHAPRGLAKIVFGRLRGTYFVVLGQARLYMPIVSWSQV
ncbi:hypothetical protein WJX79_006070 [Trebouxia sp. C0005]